MKPFAMALASFATLMCFGTLGTAKDDIEQLSETQKIERSCARIQAACRKAGFKKTVSANAAKKGLLKDCMAPLLRGESVNGVSIDDVTLNACQAMNAKWKATHGHRGQRSQGPLPGMDGN
jgi:hypothetical protein